MKPSEIDWGNGNRMIQRMYPSDGACRGNVVPTYCTFAAKLRLRRLALKQSIYDDHGMNVEILHVKRQIMKNLSAVSFHTYCWS